MRLNEEIRVVVCSIGSPTKYDLVTKEISSKGFFLEYDSPSHSPFQTSMILEVWMYLGSSIIFFSGRVCRLIFTNGNDLDPKRLAGISIRIIDILPENQEELQNFIDANALKKNGNSDEVA